MCGARTRLRILAARSAAIHIALVSMVLSGCALAEAGVNHTPKRVPILYSFDNKEGIYTGFDRVLRSELRSGVPERVELCTEYLDLVRFPAPGHSKDSVKLLMLKFSERLLPAGTAELFREPPGWERYRNYILAIAALCVLEAILIVTLIFSRQKRRRVEEALLQEKTLSDAVIDVIPGLFFLQDESGRNLRWNKNSEMLARHAPSEVTRLENVADEYKNAAEQAQQEIFAKGFGEVELEILAKDGRRVPYYCSGVRVELDGKPYLAAVGVDITHRKQSEQALRVSEAELRSFVEHAPYGIGRTSVKEDRFLSANPALVKMLGYRSEAELLALTLTRDLYSEADAHGFRAQPTRADFFSGVEFVWRRKDGRPINLRASGRRLSGKEQGDIIEIIVEDVSARRVLEEQLRQAQKMEALGQLAGSVAHDFNNLVAVIIGYSELLSNAVSADGLSRTRVEIIRKAGEQAASLTAQLLAFSRRSVMQAKVVNLNSMVMETNKMLHRLMGEDVEHKLVLDSNLGRTRADPGQMVQVIMNLAVNARDAMPRGGQLTIKTASVVFHQEVVMQDVAIPAGRYVMLSVGDTGIGMDAETKAHLFEPFFTTKPVGKGTGLGLATVYGIVKQSGGFIFADSELGTGTTFRVYLPEVEQAAEAVPVRTSTMEPQSLETILLVEDEAAFRDLLEDGLHSNGFKVLVGENGVAALQIAEQHQGTISLLVTDVIMPQMSGPELARRLKEVRPEIDVLYISGYTDDKLRDLSTPDSEVALIQKPFYVNELAAKIREMLKRQPAASTGAAAKQESRVVNTSLKGH